MKTRLKILLICLWILLVLGWTWAGLTKAWIIPNWIGISLWDIDCKWKSFVIEGRWSEIPTINWRECKKWTYRVGYTSPWPDCPMCQ